MNIEEFRNYCLSKIEVTEVTPFGNDVLVFKVHQKMFALCGLDKVPLEINLKCNPEWAVELREQYQAVKPGYHMSKKHWNTVVADGSISSQLLRQQIDHSYGLVVVSLPLKLRNKLAKQNIS